MRSEIDIKFKPITKIRTYMGGKTVTLFYPSRTYDGFKYSDGTILAVSAKRNKPISINENDIIIVEICP